MNRTFVSSGRLIGLFFAALLPLTALAQSASDCAAEADRAVRDRGTLLGGAARGAVRGAVFGAIVGNKQSARRGAALGAGIGTVRRFSQNNDVYRYVYDDCMRGRHYRY